MAPWVKEKAEYIDLDFKIAQYAPKLLKLDDIFKLVGKKKKYTIEDAKSIQKKQYSAAKYKKSNGSKKWILIRTHIKDYSR